MNGNLLATARIGLFRSLPHQTLPHNGGGVQATLDCVAPHAGAQFRAMTDSDALRESGHRRFWRFLEHHPAVSSRPLESFFPESLSKVERNAVLHVLRQTYLLSPEEIKLFLGRMRERGSSLGDWKGFPDTAHSSLAAHLVRKLLPEVDHRTRSGLLIDNPFIAGNSLASTTGLPPFGEFDILVRNFMQTHWDRFQNLPGDAIQLVQAMIYQHPDLRFVFWKPHRSFWELETAAERAIGLSLRTMDGVLQLDAQRLLWERWGRQLPKFLLLLEGRRERFDRLLALTPEGWEAILDRATEANFWLSKGFFSSSLSLVNSVNRRQWANRVVEFALLEAYFERRDATREDVERWLEPWRDILFAPEIKEVREAPAQLEGMEWPTYLPLRPQVEAALHLLEQYGFQPRARISLTQENVFHLLRGARYKAVAFSDGTMVAALELMDIISHLFFRLDRFLKPGDLKIEVEPNPLREELTELISRPLNGVAFEFEVQSDGSLRLFNHSGSYRTRREDMSAVVELMRRRGIPLLPLRDKDQHK